MSLKALQDLFDFGFIQKDEYERRKGEIQNFNDTLSSTSMEVNLNPLHTIGDFSHKPDRKYIERRVHQNEKSRNIRLFVSSTFRDMKEERNILAQNVFPEIKKICRQKHINFVYIDFRWGITAEESSGGKVIELCLNEIDNCRPYMIGILGERYGWADSGNIPDKVLSESFNQAQKRYSWLEYYKDRSVTELEMIYGALFYPEYSKSCFFYLRDPEYINKSHETRQLGMETNPNHINKLNELKLRIKNSGIPVRENYRSPQEFADLVLADFKAAIDRDFQQNLIDEDPIDRDLREAYSFAEERAQIYIQNTMLSNKIVKYIESMEESPLLILGDSGSGKTSLICKWLSDQCNNNGNKKILVVPVFFELVHVQTHKIIYYILSLLKKFFKLDKDIPTDPSELLHSLSQWLSVPGKVVLILDGIDHIGNQNLGWLPTNIPSNVRLIITCSPGNDVYKNLIGENRNWDNCLSMEPLSDIDKRFLVEKYLEQYSKKLSDNQTQDLVSAPGTISPLFLRAILEQLKLFGDFDILTQYIHKFTSAPDILFLFDLILEHWERVYNTKDHPNFVCDVLSLISVSRYGLMEAELLSILGIYQQVLWSGLFGAIGEGLVNQHGILNFAHNHLRQAVKKRYLKSNTDINRYRQMIIKYFSAKTFSERQFQEYPYLLNELGSKDELKKFLSSDIKTLLELYTPLTKYDFFHYWQMTGDSKSAPALYQSSLQKYKTKVSPKEFANMNLKFANFLQENGNLAEAAPVITQSLNIFKEIDGENSKSYSDGLFELAQLYNQQAQYNLAFQYAEQCLNIRKIVFSEMDPKVADCIWLQALIKKKNNLYKEAIALYEKALSIVKIYYGDNHPQIANYLKTIADVYRKQAVYDKAITLYENALSINKNAYGLLHPSVGQCLDSLGRIHKKKGNYSEAKELYLEALDILEKMYGTEHLLVAETYNNLGDVERKLSNFEVAERLYLKALQVNEQQLGLNHPELAETLNSLGIIYKIRGDMEKAIQYIDRAIKIVKDAFDDKNIKCARFMNNLADCYAITARYVEAKNLYYGAMEINITVLGKDHPEVSENLNALGKIAKKRGLYDEALEYVQRSLDIIIKVYGPNHPKAAIYMHDLGVNYRKKKMFEKSWENYSRARELNESQFGPDSPEVAMNLNGLGMLLRAWGKDLDEASRLHEQALSIFERKFGQNHEKVALTLNLLAEVYRKQGKFSWDGAEALYHRALSINRSIFGEEHPEVAENLNGLAQVYKAQFSYIKAEPLFLDAIAISERTLGKYHPHVINRYRNLADLYERWGKVEDSKRIWVKVDELKKNYAKEIG